MAVILRSNFGSLRYVKRVFAFDPHCRTALVLWADAASGAPEGIGEVTTDELEALTERREYASVEETLRRRADYILNREE